MEKLRSNIMDKKRVLYFIPEFPRISETFIEREVSRLIQNNNLDIKILSLAQASGTTSAQVTAQTVYKRLRIRDFFSGLLYFVTKPAQVRAAHALLQPGSVGFYFFLKALGYTKIMADFKPQHIHVHFLSWPSTVVMIASTILDIPYSISAHARDVFIEGELIPQKAVSAKFVGICNSYAYQKTLDIIGNQIGSAHVKLIYHGIDHTIFESPATMNKPSVPLIFLGGTRLVEKKGLKYMIEASKILKDKGINHRVDLVGSGPLYQELNQQIQDLDLSDRVILHGNGKGTPFQQVLEYYKIADVFVLPSIETGQGDADGVPTVAIEAAMAKLPIIATVAGGISDLVVDNVTGIVVEQKNPQAIAEAVIKVLTDKNLADRLAHAAYEKALGMFDIQKNVGLLEKLLS